MDLEILERALHRMFNGEPPAPYRSIRQMARAIAVNYEAEEREQSAPPPARSGTTARLGEVIERYKRHNDAIEAGIWHETPAANRYNIKR